LAFSSHFSARREHRTVRFLQDVAPHLDHQVRPHAQDVPVESLVVQEPADGAALLVGPPYTLTERLLVEALHGHARDVASARLGRDVADWRRGGAELAVVHGHLEAEGSGIVAYDVYRPHRQVLALHDPVEVDERDLLLESAPQADVVAMALVSAAIAVEEEPVASMASS
jgi:hypothetical protein